MQKKIVTTFSRTFSLGLLLCLLVAVAPAFAQEEDSLAQLSLSVGANGYDLQALCITKHNWRIPILSAGLKFPVHLRWGDERDEQVEHSIIYVGPVITFNAEGKPWGPPPYLEANFEQAGGPTMTIMAEGEFPIQVRPRLSFNLLMGVGINYQFGYEREERIAEALILKSSADPIITYGGRLGFWLTDEVEVQLIVRGSSAIVGNQRHIRPDNTSFKMDTGTITWVDYRFGVVLPLRL